MPNKIIYINALENLEIYCFQTKNNKKPKKAKISKKYILLIIFLGPKILDNTVTKRA